MAPDADIIIIGGGCAGLSLATRLARAPCRTPRTLILEPRTTYTNDRTWSGWRTSAHPFLSCVRASWARWAISYRGTQIVRGDGRQIYDTIPADRFYETAVAAIATTQSLRLMQGVQANASGQQNETAWVCTNRGRLTARLIVDTRPPKPRPGLGLLQSFAGLEVETTEPCFDPSTVGLMAFEPEGMHAITFLYTLPFSRTRALLEWTHMAPAHHAAPTEAALTALLRQRLGCDFTIHRSEAGCLPMQTMQHQPAPPRLLRLGTPAGALRASTGYGFATIQAQAESLATLLNTDPQNALGWRAAPPPAWMRGMDALFLRVLRRHPEAGPNLLTTLFRRCPTAPLIRFLSGTGSLLDGGRVALSMPKAPFLRELAGTA